MRASASGAAKAAATAAARMAFFVIGISLVQFLARKARGVVRIADAVIDGFLRVRAVRAGTGNSRYGARADDAVRRDALLHPLDERRQPVDRAVPDAAAAVRHARNEVELEERVDDLFAAARLLRLTAHEIDHPLAVADGAHRVRAGIAPPVVHEDLRVAPQDPAQVGIGGVVDPFRDLHLERLDVPVPVRQVVVARAVWREHQPFEGVGDHAMQLRRAGRGVRQDPGAPAAVDVLRAEWDAWDERLLARVNFL